MGGLRKRDTIIGRDLDTAFQELQKSDEYEYGNDSYNGRWNNAQGIVEVSKSKFEKDYPDKHEPCWALCVQKPISNNMKVKTKVSDFPVKGTRKWITKYVVEDPRWGNIIVSELTKGKAVEKARKLVEKNPDWILKVIITKELQGDKAVSKIEYKKSSKERDGRWEIKGCLSY